MKIILKLLSIIGLIGILSFSFILGGIPLSEGKHIIKPYIDTHFSENYTPDKFDNIHLGMKKSKVIELIGKPLNIGQGYNDSLMTNYYYTGDGKFQYDDFAWYRSTVGFDTNEIVVYIDKGWSYD